MSALRAVFREESEKLADGDTTRGGRRDPAGVGNAGHERGALARAPLAPGSALGLMLAALVGTMAMTYGLNRFVHDVYVTDGVPGDTLRVMSWNVGKLYLPWESRAADRDLAHVARVIRELGPHVVALQELRDPEQLGRLVAMLGPGWRAKTPRDSYDRRAGLLIRLRGRFFELPTSSGRVAQGVQIALAGGHELVLASIHLDAFDSQRRLHQAEEITASLKELAADCTILLGDCNFDPTVAETDPLDLRTYHLLTAEYEDIGRESGATTLFSRRLDYIFINPPGRFPARALVIRGARINAMDHDPVVADLELNTALR